MAKSSVDDGAFEAMIRDTFKGVPVDSAGRKIQSLMYYVFDIGRLGIGDNADMVKCFKNEISTTMQSIAHRFLEDRVCDSKEDAADILNSMCETLCKELNELLGYMFNGNVQKKEFFVSRIRTYSEGLVDRIRRGVIVPVKK